MKMLILRGKAGYYEGQDWPRGALHEAPALEYATRRSYDGRVLDIAGLAYKGSPQHKLALEEYRGDVTIDAIYGFSAGGYNVYHFITDLTAAERGRLQLVVVLGAPDRPEASFKGPWELVYRRDPPGGHMKGPDALLAAWDAAHP
jgi:hypothetical protein